MMNILRLAINKVLKPFSDLADAPRAIWYVIGAFALDSIAYFGLLTLMTTYLSQDLGWGDKYAGITVSIFTMSVTLAMLGVGSVAESFGLRRAILAALVVAVIGRAVYCLVPSAPGGWSTIAMIGFGLLLAALSGGILQPVCYSGVRQFTNEKTSSMGYAMIYAFTSPTRKPSWNWASTSVPTFTTNVPASEVASSAEPASVSDSMSINAELNQSKCHPVNVYNCKT